MTSRPSRRRLRCVCVTCAYPDEKQKHGRLQKWPKFRLGLDRLFPFQHPVCFRCERAKESGRAGAGQTSRVSGRTLGRGWGIGAGEEATGSEYGLLLSVSDRLLHSNQTLRGKRLRISRRFTGIWSLRLRSAQMWRRQTRASLETAQWSVAHQSDVGRGT